METDELELTFRTWNTLQKSGYTSVSDLTCKTEKHILDVRGIGHAALAEIRAALAVHDLYMGMTGPAYNE